MKEEKVKNVKKATNGKIHALIEERKKKAKKKKEMRRLKISDIKHSEGASVHHLLRRIQAKESQLTFFCVTVFLFIILIGFYFVFSSVREPVRYNTTKVGDFEVTFSDRGKTLGNIVDLTPVQPLSLEEGEKTKAYQIKIVNTSPEEQAFQVKLMKDVAMINEDSCSDLALSNRYIYYQIDAYTPQLLDDTKRSPILYTNTLESGEIQFLEIRLWVDENLPSEYFSYHYHGKLSVKNIETAL